MKIISVREENIEGKGNTVDYQHYLLFQRAMLLKYLLPQGLSDKGLIAMLVKTSSVFNKSFFEYFIPRLTLF